MARKLPGRAIQAGTITVTQLDSSTSTVIQTGGGPKITNVQVTNNSWTVLDDTAVDIAGGYILITGTGFNAGVLVYFNQTPASSVSYISSTTLRVTVPALAAGTYILYVINTDGGTAIRVPGVTASASPAWQTGSTLPEQYDNTAISLNLVATDATVYTLTSGSLPPGLSLNANTGVISGTVTTVTVDTSYTFTVTATDAQNQDSPRTFTVTITVSDPYFKLTTLLLGGEQGNTVVRDSSVNNFNLTVFGDSRASNFTPYGTGWSAYFSGAGIDKWLTQTNYSTSSFTAECWIYLNASATSAAIIGTDLGTDNYYNWWSMYLNASGYLTCQTTSVVNGPPNTTLTDTVAFLLNQWVHVAMVFDISVGSLSLYKNGIRVGYAASGSTNYSIVTDLQLGGLVQTSGGGYTAYLNCYMAAVRISRSVVYSGASFTVPSQYFTSNANTNLLVYQTNRYNDLSANAYAISTKNSRVVSFNPFNITNTGDSGSMYFDGTGDYVTAPGNNAFALTSADWTIEVWIYPTILNTYNFIYSREASTNATTEIELYFGVNGALNLNVCVSSTLYSANTSSGAIIANQWQHVAAVRNGGTLTIYVNGVSTGTNTTLSTLSLNDPGTSYVPNIINQAAAANRGMQGYASNFRFVRGTAVYTANFVHPPSHSPSLPTHNY